MVASDDPAPADCWVLELPGLTGAAGAVLTGIDVAPGSGADPELVVDDAGEAESVADDDSPGDGPDAGAPAAVGPAVGVTAWPADCGSLGPVGVLCEPSLELV